METAGKFVEDEELRAALKENGIGRPSSRAGIIETLFKRHYIRRQRKNLMATPTGIELIDTIHEELLKSCELTGIWEKKLRDIEHKTYDPADFINGLKEQINKIVIDVLSDNSNRRVTIMTEEDLKKKPAAKKLQPRKPIRLQHRIQILRMPLLSRLQLPTQWLANHVRFAARASSSRARPPMAAATGRQAANIASHSRRCKSI